MANSADSAFSPDSAGATRAARRLAVRLCAAGGLAYCSYAMCRSPVLPLFARHLGAGPEVVGMVVGASTLTGVFLKLPAGALSDVFGRRALLVAGAAVFALAPFAYLPVAALSALVLLRLVHGSATAIFGPVASATLSDVAPAARRGVWLGTYSAVQGAGQALGQMLSGYLVARNDFSRSFLASGLVGVAALALVFGWPGAPPTAAGSTGASSTGRWRRLRLGIREVAGDARILTTSLAQAGQFFLHGTISAFVPLYAKEVLGLNTLQIGLVFGVQTISLLAARPVFGAISDRVGRRPVISAGLIACGAAMWAVSLATGMLSLLASAAAFGAGMAVTTSATGAFITDLSRRARYGAAHGIFGTIYDIGDVSGPVAAGFLVASIGYRPMFRWVALAAAVLAVVFAWLSRNWERDTAQVDSREVDT